MGEVSFPSIIGHLCHPPPSQSILVPTCDTIVQQCIHVLIGAIQTFTNFVGLSLTYLSGHESARAHRRWRNMKSTLARRPKSLGTTMYRAIAKKTPKTWQGRHLHNDEVFLYWQALSPIRL